MQVYVRKRRRNSSPVLIVTHLLCLLIGFSICYAVFRPSEPAPHSAHSDTPETTAGPEEGGTVPETPPSEDGGAPVPEDPPAEVPPAEEALAGEQPSEPPPASEATTDSPETAPGEASQGSPETAAHPEDVWPARRLFVKVKGTQLDDAARAFLSGLKPGGVVLQGDNIENKEQTTALVAEIKQAVGLGTGIADLPLIAVDQEGGAVNRLKLDAAPSAAELAKKRDLDAVRGVGKRYAQECVDRGIAIILAPVLDVYESGAETSMETRSFGRNSKLCTAMGLAFADGAMSGGVLPVVKHYPGHGVAKQDSHVALAVTEKNGAELAKVAVPFIKAAERGIPGIMVGHIAAPAVDLEDPMRPASLSPLLVKTIFRERYKYDGVIVTDDIAMGAITASRSLEEAAVQALNAGCDAVIVLDPDPERISAVCDAIDGAAESGALPQAALQDSVRRLDAWQAWLRNPSGLKQPLPDLSDVPEEEPIAAEAAVEPEAPASELEPDVAPPGTKKVVYQVKAGDTLSRIAGAHGVKMDDIAAWNHLKDQKVLLGAKLTLYVADDSAPQEPAPASEESPDASAADGDVVAVESAGSGAADSGRVEPDAGVSDEASGETEESGTESETYTLAAGDTLSKVAARFNIPLDELAKFNGIDDPTKLHVGQKIKIPKP